MSVINVGQSAGGTPLIISSVRGMAFPKGWSASRTNEWLLRSNEGDIGLLARIPLDPLGDISIYAEEPVCRKVIQSVAEQIRLSETITQEIYRVMAENTHAGKVDFTLPADWMFRKRGCWQLVAKGTRPTVLAVFDIEDDDSLVYGIEAPDARGFLQTIISEFRRCKKRERKILDAFRDCPLAEKALQRKVI
ncbi:hypothetical protein [Thioclava kandeliae]|uniref:Uncharacterized protein n=2 Tax=Thioclava TaxID=285107 RepID=A0ABV1SEE4_9RHOB